MSNSGQMTSEELAGVRRVLIYRLGSFGDTVILLPCLHRIAQVFAKAERRMLTNFPIHGKAPSASAVLGDTGLIHSYIRYTVGERSPMALLNILFAVRSFKPDLLIYLAMPRGAAALARDRRFFRLCGVRRIIGLPEGDLAVNLPLGHGVWEHEAARLARTIAALGPINTEDPRSYDIQLNASEQEEAYRVLRPMGDRPLIACGPGAKMQSKDWGSANWRALLNQLADLFPGHGLVMVGAADDHTVGEEASAAWVGRSLNLCGKLPPRISAAVLAHAELFIGPDSGPMHMASALEVPCAIAFASRTRKGMWFPVGPLHRVVWHELSCSNCDLETCIENRRRCLTTITVDEMVEAALAAWKAGQSRPPRRVRGAVDPQADTIVTLASTANLPFHPA